MSTITLTILTAFLTAVFGPLIVEWTKLKFLNRKISVLITCQN